MGVSWSLVLYGAEPYGIKPRKKGGREASLWDALFDSLGVLTAAGTYRMLTERIRSLNRSLNAPEREVIHEEKTGNHH